MITFEKQLEERAKQGKPIRVGLIGAGFAGRGFALQLLTGFPGMQLAAIANHTPEYAIEAYANAGITDIDEIKSENEMTKAITSGKYTFTTDPLLLTRAKEIDVVVEATGEVEFGAKVVLDAIKHKKHVVLINAELDTTLGPLLKTYADRVGVVYTQADGDQPAKIFNLYREVKLLGFRPVLCGNIKSLTDHYRTPVTQKDFADAHFQRTKFITTFADGTKIAFEMATVANATGFRVGKRGMYGPKCSSVSEAANLFAKDELLKQGLVDYIYGAEPSFGVFVLAYSDQPIRQRYLAVYKMGDGPFYTFYLPSHLSPLEAPFSVARAFLYHDAALSPTYGSVCDVVTLAKRDLAAGETLDGIGGFTIYGLLDNSEILRRENLLPIGLSTDAKLIKDIKRDQPITYEDVVLPSGRLSISLRKEQEKYFGANKL